MSKAGNLTEGNIVPKLIKLATPLLIGSIFQQFYNTVDSLVIGRFLGETAFGAVGIAGTVMNLFIFLISGFCTGISIILAEFYGSGNMKRFRDEFFTAASFGVLFTVILSSAAILLMPFILSLINTPKDIAPFVKDYLTIILAGLIITFFYNFFAASLRSAGNTDYALIFLITAILLNTVLDVLFIGFFDMGIAGAAWATIFSQFVSASFCLLCIRLKFSEFLPKKENMRYDKLLLLRTVSYSSVSALQSSSLFIGKLLVQGTVNLLGNSAIAAYTATGRIEGIANSFGVSCGEAVSIFVAQNVGADKFERAKDGFFKGMKINIALGLIFSVLLFLGSKWGVILFVGAKYTEAVNQGSAYLKTVAIFYILCFVGNTYVGWFRGTRHLKVPFFGTTMQIIIRVILSACLAPVIGLKAVALATGIGWCALITYHTIMYRYYEKVRKRDLNTLC